MCTEKHWCMSLPASCKQHQGQASGNTKAHSLFLINTQCSENALLAPISQPMLRTSGPTLLQMMFFNYVWKYLLCQHVRNTKPSFSDEILLQAGRAEKAPCNIGVAVSATKADISIEWAVLVPSPAESSWALNAD